MILPICFSNPYKASPQAQAQAQAQAPKNLTTSIYQAQLCNTPVLLTFTWSKTPLAHSLTIQAPELFSTTIPLKPSRFSLFRDRPCSKSITLTHPYHHNKKIKLYWDFTRAEFTRESAEPESSYYIGITCDGKVDFFLGDGKLGIMISSTKHEICGMAEPTQLSKREHVFGRKTYRTRTTFMGIRHDIELDCAGGVLKVKVDGEVSIVVKRLAWKFRGNDKILIGGMWVDFFWDVFNWVSGERGRRNSYGVFAFQLGDGGWFCPEMVEPEKKLMRKSLSASTTPVMLSPSPSCSTVMQWAEENSDCGRSSCSSSVRSTGSCRLGFSLVLYAWRVD
ncbi:hypothetical protein Dimus_021789 [Dionaea muscipula]